MITDLGFALVIAVVMTILLAAVFMNLGMSFHVMRLFAILILGIWGGGRVTTPVGPSLWGVKWLPMIITGLACAGFCLGSMLLARVITRRIAAQLEGFYLLGVGNHIHSVPEAVAGDVGCTDHPENKH